jgi:hypothetical protein
MDFTRLRGGAATCRLACRNANCIRGTPAEICDGTSNHSETPMPASMPKPNAMLPIDSDDHTLEVDMRSFLMERPDIKVQMEGTDSDSVYEDPRLGDALTATQVLDLLNLGK